MKNDTSWEAYEEHRKTLKQPKPGGSLTTKELWELGRRIEITVPVVDPQVKWEDGSGGQGTVVFHAFATDVTDPETGEDLGMVSGGTGCVVITRKGIDGMWQISHEAIWYAFCEAIKEVGPIPIVPRPPPKEVIKLVEPEPEPIEILVTAPEPEPEDDHSIVYLEVIEYLVGNHYYVRLSTKGSGRGIDVEYTLTRGQAERLSDATYHYKEGGTATRFLTYEHAIKRGIEVWKELYPDSKVLIKGSPSSAQAQAVLVGFDEQTQAKLNALYLDCVDMGWWDGDDEEVAIVEGYNREWAQVFNEAMGQKVFSWG